MSTAIIDKSTGEKKTAVYATTPIGNKRYNVDGKFYSDKKFAELFGIMPEKVPLMWKSQVRELFEEILSSNETMAIFNQPFRITLSILGAMAIHAEKMKDEKMIGYCCRLGLYAFSDPTDKDYDESRNDYYINKTAK